MMFYIFVTVLFTLLGIYLRTRTSVLCLFIHDGHTLLQLRKPINLAQVCISNDRAVPAPGFKQYNSRPTPTKTTKQIHVYSSFDNFNFDFLVLVVYTSVIDCFRKCLKFFGAIIASVLLNNSM